jgi:hypothetical protein
MTNDDSNDDLAPKIDHAETTSGAADSKRARGNSLAEDDRRCQERRDDRDSVRIKLAESELTGHVQNVSEDGLFLVLDGPLVVEIESDSEVGVPARHATLVRCQSLPGGKSGWGIRFEPVSEDD